MPKRRPLNTVTGLRDIKKKTEEKLERLSSLPIEALDPYRNGEVPQRGRNIAPLEEYIDRPLASRWDPGEPVEGNVGRNGGHYLGL